MFLIHWQFNAWVVKGHGLGQIDAAVSVKYDSHLIYRWVATTTFAPHTHAHRRACTHEHTRIERPRTLGEVLFIFSYSIPKWTLGGINVQLTIFVILHFFLLDCDVACSCSHAADEVSPHKRAQTCLDFVVSFKEIWTLHRACPTSSIFFHSFFFFFNCGSTLAGPYQECINFQFSASSSLLVRFCPQLDWTQRIMMTECCSAACNTSASTQSVLSSCAREFSPSPMQHTAAAAECVSSANNTHACDCEWVQPDSSS